MNIKQIFNYAKYTTTKDRFGQDQTVSEFDKFKFLKHVAAALGIFILVSFLWPLREVPTGHRGIYTIGGKITATTSEGYTLIWPWERLNNFSIRPDAATVEGAEGATADTQPVKVSLTVRYTKQPDKVDEIFELYSHDGNMDSYVDTATREAFKAVTAQYTATELISKRAEVSTKFSSAIQAKLNTYYVKVVSVDVTSFLFSDSYMQAINMKVTEEQKKLAAENRAKTVEAEQRVKVVTAEAEAHALKAKADGEAYSVLTAAQANAKALKVQNDALAQNRDVLELKRIEVELTKAQKWDGALPTHIYGSAPVPYMNVPTGK